MNFSNNLKRLRKEKGFKQADLADLLELQRSTIGKWENGVNYPSVEILDKLAALLEVSTDELLGRAPQIERYKRDAQNVRLLSQYSKLNDLGKREAVKRVAELCMIPQYTAASMPVAAHTDKSLDDKELELMRQDIDEL